MILPDRELSGSNRTVIITALSKHDAEGLRLEILIRAKAIISRI
jgi:hypothetical protein